MKKLYFLFLVLFTHLAYAQVPQGIPYQAAARNASGQALVNTAVKVRFSILDSVATGTVVYKETHNTTTNSVGLFNVNVGMGTAVTGTFSAINWGKNAKFMQMELDITGTGSSYVDMGTQQMLSVPYALYAGNAASAKVTTGTGNYAGASIVNPNDYNSVTINGTPTNAYIPPFLYDCGNGSEGNFTVSGTYDATQSMSVSYHQFKNLTIPVASTYSLIYANGGVATNYIYVSDTLKIQGTILGKAPDAVVITGGSGWLSGRTMTNSVGAGGGGATYFSGPGSGEGSTLSWTPQTLPNYIPPYGGISIYGGGGSNNPSATLSSTTNGQSPTTAQLITSLRLFPNLEGGSGAPTTSSSNYVNSPGGKGGAGIYIVCKVLVFSGTVDLRGGKGANMYTGYSGYYGGGGGGGSVVISAEQVLQNTGTFNLNGGSDYLNSGFRKGGNGAYLIIDR
jgi:hypothetical protein